MVVSTKDIFLPGIHASLKELISESAFNKKYLLPKLRKTQGAFLGNEESRFHGRGMDFAESRVYQAGDDSRRIDWRVTARSNVPHTKVFHEERERPVYFLVDHNASMFFGTKGAFKSVVAAKRCARLAWAASKGGCSVGGVVYSGERLLECKPRLRRHGVLPLLQHLSQSSLSCEKQSVEKSFLLALQHVQRHVRPGSFIVIFSDFYGLTADAESYLKQLSQHNKISLHHVFDQLEKCAPPPNYYAVTDGDKQLMINTTQKKLCRRYEESFSQHQKMLKNTCKRLGMLYEECTYES